MGIARAGETQNPEGGNAEVFGAFSSFPSKDVALPLKRDLISGGNCSIMERTPSIAAFLSHAFQANCLMFLLTMARFCTPSPEGHSR